jgi:tetratricopeptide (TPR) repeat protein
MIKKLSVVFMFAVIAGCAGHKRSDSALDLENPPDRAGGKVPVFSLPGVPMKSEMEAEDAAKKPAAPATQAADQAADTPDVLPAGPAAAVPAEHAPVSPAPAAAKPAIPAADSGDLTFHLNAAKKYSARKQYRSAAAEYEAAVPFLPAGDPRAVRLLERQGAMFMKLGARSRAKAEEYFLSAIAKAKELGSTGDGLADAYIGLGYCQGKERKAQEAIASYQKALELSDSKEVKDRITDAMEKLKKKQ